MPASFRTAQFACEARQIYQLSTVPILGTLGEGDMLRKISVGLGLAFALAACEGTLGEELSVREAKPAVAALLKDPSSAQFTDVHALGSCVTGKVNAKNGFGGYTGFIDFTYNAITKLAAIDPGALSPITSPADLASNETVIQYAEFAAKCTSDAAHAG